MDRKIGMSIAAGRPQMALVFIPGEGFLPVSKSHLSARNFIDFKKI